MPLTGLMDRAVDDPLRVGVRVVNVTTMNDTGRSGRSRRRFCATVAPCFWKAPIVPALTLPARAGPATRELREIREMISRTIERGELPGIVVLVQNSGTRPHIEAVGWRDISGREPMRPDTIFDVRSITKTVTALASLLLVADGKLSLDEPIERYLPEERNIDRNGAGDQSGIVSRPITVRHLLTHTSGLSQSRPASLEDLTERRDVPLPEVVSRILKEPRPSKPGTKWEYSSPGFAVLGRVVEVVSGKPLDEFVTRRILTPLGMRNSTFNPKGIARRRIASLYQWKGDRVVDWPRMMPTKNWSYTAPDFGLYATAADLAALLGSMWPGSRCLLPDALRTLMLTGNVATDLPGLKQGLGWMVSDGDGLCQTMGLSSGCFGHNGAFGSMAWASLRQRRIVVFLTQCLGSESQAGVQVIRASLCGTADVPPV